MKSFSFLFAAEPHTLKLFFVLEQISMENKTSLLDVVFDDDSNILIDELSD